MTVSEERTGLADGIRPLDLEDAPTLDARVLKAACAFASKDRSRERLCGVYVELWTGGYEVAATDGYTLFRALRGTRPRDGQGKTLRYLLKGKKLGKSLGDYRCADIAGDLGGSVVLKVGDGRFDEDTLIIGTLELDGQWVGYRGLIVDEEAMLDGSACLKADYVKRCANAIRTACGKAAGMRISFTGANQPVVFTPAPNEVEGGIDIQMLVMPIRDDRAAGATGSGGEGRGK